MMYRKKQFPSISTGRDLKGGALLVSTKGTSSLKRPSLSNSNEKREHFSILHPKSTHVISQVHCSFEKSNSE
jgi:hypothetical protein